MKAFWERQTKNPIETKTECEQWNILWVGFFSLWFIDERRFRLYFLVVIFLYLIFKLKESKNRKKISCRQNTEKWCDAHVSCIFTAVIEYCVRLGRHKKWLENVTFAVYVPCYSHFSFFVDQNNYHITTTISI